MADFLEAVLSDEPPAMEPELAPEPEITEPVVIPEPPVEPSQPQQGFVPMAAMLDERDKRKALEAQVAQYQSQQQVGQQIPDPLDDPEGHYAFLASQMQTALYEQKMQFSADRTVERHGEEIVGAATQWAAQRAQTDPAFQAQWHQIAQTNSNPMEWVVRQHQRDAKLSVIGDTSLDDWFTQEAAKRGYVAQSAPVAAAPAVVSQAPRPVAPPRSIASEAPASAPATANDAKAEFDAIFNGR